MPLKIQLQSGGAVVNCNPDPEGLNKFELEIKRSSEHDGLFYEFGVNLKFFKEARRFIRDVYESDGIDGRIDIIIFEYEPNEYKYTQIYTGTLRLQDYEIDEIGVTVNVEQESLEREFINRIEVDTEIPTSDTLTVPSKKILQRFKAANANDDLYEENAIITFNFSSNANGQTRNATRYIMFDANDQEFNELDSYNIGGLNYAVSEFDAVPFLEIVQGEQGLYDFDFNLKHEFQIIGLKLFTNGDIDVGTNNTHTPPFTITPYFERRDSNNAVIEKVQIGTAYNSLTAGDFGTNTVSVPFQTNSYSATDVQVNAGDRIYIYYQLDLGTNDFRISDQPQTVQYDFNMNTDPAFSGFNVEANGETEFQDTDVQVTFSFDLFDFLIRSASGGQLSLKSEVLGRKTFLDIFYTVDGEAALIALTTGNKLKQNNTKKLFTNFKEAFDSYNAMFCLGWGFETDNNGNRFVRIEKKEYFFNNSTVVLNVESSKDLVKRAKKDAHYTRVEAGFPNYEPLGAKNAQDEFNTSRKYSANISQADNELKLLSTYRASSYEIESLRRLQFNTEGTRLDDEIFLIQLIRDDITEQLRVEVGTDYTLIENIFDPDSAFNIRLRPSQFVVNWKPVLSSVTFRKANKDYEFNSGKLNNEFSVDGLSESRNIEMNNLDALYLCEEVEFETALTMQERQLVAANPRGLISVKDWVGNEIQGFLITSKTVLEQKKGTFILLKANVEAAK